MKRYLHHTARTGKREGGLSVKKRALSILCALALCVGLLAAYPSVSAAGTPCFLALNDTLKPLEDAFIPITVSGQYYVPHTALDSSVTGVSLGVVPLYNTISNTLMIFAQDKLEKQMIFDLTTGACTDRNGTALNARAVIRNGRIYVPARVVCDYFGLSYSNRITLYGPIVRIRSASSHIDDNNFIGLVQLEMKMEKYLQDWRGTQAAEDPAVTPSVSPTPVPTPTPGEGEADKSGVRAYLAFRADRIDALEQLLGLLEQAQVQALFFFPAEELAGYDDAVRRVLCGGHAVGLLVSGADGAEILAQAAQGNRLLSQIGHLHTYTVLVAGEQSDELREQLRSAGILCWNTDVDALPDGRSASRQSSAVQTEMDRYSREVYVLSDASAAGAALMERLLPELVEDRYDLRLAVETQL